MRGVGETRETAQKSEEDKVIEEYKLSEDFLEDVAEGSMSAFYERFKNCKNNMKEFFLDVNVALFIPSITDSIKEKATEIQEDSDVLAEAPPSTTPEAYLLLRCHPTLKHLWRLSLKLYQIKQQKYKGLSSYVLLLFLFF